MKTKLSFIAAGAFALLLPACSADVELPHPSDNAQKAISYNVASSNLTRAAASYNSNNLPEELKVWAYIASPTTQAGEYFAGDVIKKNTNGSYYDETGDRYWPEGEDVKMNFFAYAGADLSENFNFNNGAPTFSYTVKSSVAEQEDVLYSVKNDATAEDGDVNLNFRHALSQVAFKGKFNNAALTIKVNSISVGNIKNASTYTLPSASTATDASDKGTWAAPSGNVTYDINLETPATLSSIGSDITDQGTSAFGTTLILMPQETAACAENVTETPSIGAYFKLNLSVFNTDGNQPIATNKDFYVPVSVNWSEGIRYVYTFVFDQNWTPSGTSKIGFTVTTDNFSNQPIEVNVKPAYVAVKMREASEDGSVPALYIADRNIGASDPSDVGLYFAFGCLDGYKKGAGHPFTAANYSLNGQINSNNLSDYFESLDGNITVEFPSSNFKDFKFKQPYDAASSITDDNFEWYIPTGKDLEWITNNCLIQNSSVNGIGGIRITSTNTNQTIFIPNGGYYANTLANFSGTYLCNENSVYLRTSMLDYTMSAGTVYCVLTSTPSNSNCGWSPTNPETGVPIRPVAHEK